MPIFFLLKENVSNFFLPKCQYVQFDQNVNKLSLLDENVINFINDDGLKLTPRYICCTFYTFGDKILYFHLFGDVFVSKLYIHG